MWFRIYSCLKIIQLQTRKGTIIILHFNLKTKTYFNEKNTTKNIIEYLLSTIVQSFLLAFSHEIALGIVDYFNFFLSNTTNKVKISSLKIYFAPNLICICFREHV
jgi:hypothetical protein